MKIEKILNNRYFAAFYKFVEGASLTEDDVKLPPPPAEVDTDSAENRWLQTEQNNERSLRTRYEAWYQRKGVAIFNDVYRVASVLICLTIICTMLSVVSSLPTLGSSDNPTVNEVVDRYVSKSIEETGTVNSVAGMISAYRGFDTLGEAHVLFVAACSVIVLLRVDPSSRKKNNAQVLDKLGQDMSYEPKNDIILQKSAMILVPLAFIFGLYVILNGTSSPGGGFSGGAIIGAGLILHTVALGFRRTERFFNDEVYHIVKTTCLTVYAILMAYFIYTGANGLDNHVWLGIPGTILSGGIILPINIAVGFEVACTMYSFYALFRKGGL
jgi:multicomponent Na+:H+ antiporter subunit B